MGFLYFSYSFWKLFEKIIAQNKPNTYIAHSFLQIYFLFKSKFLNLNKWTMMVWFYSQMQIIYICALRNNIFKFYIFFEKTVFIIKKYYLIFKHNEIILLYCDFQALSSTIYIFKGSLTKHPKRRHIEI